jgi:hypothetical protein
MIFKPHFFKLVFGSGFNQARSQQRVSFALGGHALRFTLKSNSSLFEKTAYSEGHFRLFAAKLVYPKKKASRKQVLRLPNFL